MEIISEETLNSIKEMLEEREKTFPSRLINGKEYPVCPLCGQVTDCGSVWIRTCQNPNCESRKKMDGLVFDI